jgi:hypothetical protein
VCSVVAEMGVRLPLLSRCSNAEADMIQGSCGLVTRICGIFSWRFWERLFVFSRKGMVTADGRGLAPMREQGNVILRRNDEGVLFAGPGWQGDVGAYN